MTTYDICIVGAGVAGSLAVLKFAQNNSKLKIAVIEAGRPPSKRRHQLEGWLGCLPNSDGKLYTNNLRALSPYLEATKIKQYYDWTLQQFKDSSGFNASITKDKGPSASLTKKVNEAGFKVELNDYIQTYPKEAHALSKYIVSQYDDKGYQFYFDTFVENISKPDDFHIITADGETIVAKKLILALGRSGWRAITSFYDNLNIEYDNTDSTIGIKAEMNANVFKELNKSACSLVKGDLEIGPFNFNGTVIPEDHINFANAAFRSNENRWKSDKLSFSISKHVKIDKRGVEELDRLGELTFIVGNNRVCREKISTLLSGKSKVSIMKEYVEFAKELPQITFIPELLTKANFYFPALNIFSSKVKLNNFETTCKDCYVIGESIGVNGLLASMITGAAIADIIK
jgi:uncharacterized FAD-dependent dehydrogenase